MTISSTTAKNESGQTMAEYAVVLTTIVIVTVATFSALGNGVETVLTAVARIFP